MIVNQDGAVLQHVRQAGSRICFVNPPFKSRFSRESRSPAVAKGGTLYYPHWLAYAAAYARHRGHSIDLFDACAPSAARIDVFQRIGQSRPQLIIVNSSTPSIYSDLEFASVLHYRFSPAPVFVVGAHASATIKECFDYAITKNLSIDGILAGEYDQIVSDIADKVMRSEDVRSAFGLAYVDRTGDVVRNPAPPLLSDLNGWPFVSEIYREFLSIPDYYYSHSKHPLVTIITGRGCPYRCTFCQLPQVMHGHTYRCRSADDVAREFRFIHASLPQVKSVMIEDDTFTVDRMRVQHICQRLIDEQLTSIPWTCNARADVDIHTLKIMKRAGARMLCVGFESGDQQILNQIRKGTRLEKIEAFVADAKKAGIMVHGCFIFGNRNETRQTMKETLDLALRLPVDTAQFFPLMLSPGTADYEFFRSSGMLVSQDFSKWNDADGNHQSTVSRPDLPSQLVERFCDHARRRFYLRPSYILAKARQSLIDFDELRRNIKGARHLARHVVRRPGAGV
ncbi:MAG: radical SAM protein [Terriglobales bacterium]